MTLGNGEQQHFWQDNREHSQSQRPEAGNKQEQVLQACNKD